MAQKALNYTVAIIFTLISILHLVRSILGWPVNISYVQIPVGVSVVAFIIGAFLAYSAFKLISKTAHPNNDQPEEKNYTQEKSAEMTHEEIAKLNQ
jgi:hypothetical protein